LIEQLKALADEKRLKILKMLLSSDLCVGALAKRLGASKPAVSQHLRILRKAGLVKGEKRGYWTHYAVNGQALVQLADRLNVLATTKSPAVAICRRISEPSLNHQALKEEEMCQNCCQQPVQLKDKPENCTPEQIQKCHGDVQGHPCIEPVHKGSEKNHPKITK
jgi:DNA-binding transcriptional ArsR family regulator